MQKSPIDDTSIVFRGEELDSVNVEDYESKSPVISMKNKALDEDTFSFIPSETPGRKNPSSKIIRAASPHHRVDSSKPIITSEIRSINETRRSYSPDAIISNSQRSVLDKDQSSVKSSVVTPTMTRQPSISQTPVVSQPSNNIDLQQQILQQQQQLILQQQQMLFQQQQRSNPTNKNTKPNYASYTQEEVLETLTMFKHKFEVLDRNYSEKKFHIPDFNNTSLDIIYDIYEDYRRNVEGEKFSENYKIFLSLFFVGVQYLGMKFISEEHFKDYANIQMTNMKKYNSMLVEIGELNAKDGGPSSPFTRLAISIILQSLLVLGFSVISKNFGKQGENMINILKSPIEGLVNNFTEVPPKTPKDKTMVADPPRKSMIHQGDALLKMAAKTFGNTDSSDFGEIIGNVGGNFLNNMNKISENTKRPKQQSKVNFGL